MRHVVPQGALVGGDAGIFRGVEEGGEGKLDGVAVAALIVTHEGKESGEFGMIRELGLAGFEHVGSSIQVTQIA